VRQGEAVGGDRYHFWKRRREVGREEKRSTSQKKFSHGQTKVKGNNGSGPRRKGPSVACRRGGGESCKEKKSFNGVRVRGPSRADWFKLGRSNKNPGMFTEKYLRPLSHHPFEEA